MNLVFLDTETLGLHPDAPVWEFAAINRYADGRRTDQIQFFIEHDLSGWLEQFPEEFARDYRSRYVAREALDELSAAIIVHQVTKDAHIVGAVPNFDTERLEKLLRRHGIAPEWHYHLIDVENLAVGFLAAKGELMSPPWNSDTLSAAIGVDPEQFARHTAMGDACWVQAQYDAVMGGTSTRRTQHENA